MMEGRKKLTRMEKTIVKKNFTWVSRPFGRFPDLLTSDSSDSDYEPDEVNVSSENPKRKRKRTRDNSSSSSGDQENLKKKPKKNKKQKSSHNNHDLRRTVIPLSSSTDSFCKSKTRGDFPTNSIGASTNSQWNSIPTEIVVKIFKFLSQEFNGIQLISRSGMTCKQWYYGSKHPSLWNKVDLSFLSNSAKANDKTIMKIVQEQGGNIKSLILSNWKKLTDKGILAISNMCPNLEMFNISGCEDKARNGKGISTDSIISVIKNSKLKNVDFSWLKLPSSNKVIHSLMEESGNELLSLNLCGCPVRSNTLNSIMESCKNLQILDISNTWIYAINIEKLQASCPKLQELYIAKSNLTIKPSSSSSKDQIPCFEDMVALSLQCDSLTDDILTQTVKNSQKLKLLDLRTCRYINIDVLLTMQASKIERLFLSHACTSFSLEEILLKWGNTLYELDLSWVAPGKNSHGLDNRSLERIASSGVKFTKMKTLDLAGTAVYDEGIRYTLEIFPNLEALNLTSCKGLSRGFKHKHHKHDLEELRKMMKVKQRK